MNIPLIRPRPILAAFGLCFILAAIGFVSNPARATGHPAGRTVTAFHQTLLSAMKDHPGDFEQRYRVLEPVVTEAFDLERMARITAGRAWDKADENTRAAFVENFTRFTITNYAARFKKYTDQSFRDGEVGNGPRGAVIVKTQFLPGDDESVAFDYVLRETNGAWRINDIFLKGAFSELATRKSEYGAVIKRQGFDALVKKIGQITEKIRSRALEKQAGQ